MTPPRDEMLKYRRLLIANTDAGAHKDLVRMKDDSALAEKIQISAEPGTEPETLWPQLVEILRTTSTKPPLLHYI